MKIIRLMLLAGILGAGWQYWNKQQDGQAMARATSSRGFVELPAPAGSSPNQVLVIAAENCSADAARRADDLEADLRHQGIPVRRTSQVNFEFSGGDSSDLLNRINRVMNAEPPIVFVRGRAKANPTLAEIVAEYRK